MYRLTSMLEGFRAHPHRNKIVLALCVLFLLILFAGEDTPPPKPEKSGVTIRVEPRNAEMHQRAVVLYGQTEASKQISLTAQTGGLVVGIPVEEGAEVEQGTTILEIDKRDRPEQVATAKAQVAQREIEYNAARKLQKGGFQTEIRLAEAKAQLQDARARLKQLELDLSFTELKAPFDGVVDRINVEIGDFVGVGTFGIEGTIAILADLDPILVSGYVSELDRAYLHIGSEATARLADGRILEGKLTYLANVAEQDSRTFRVEATFANPEHRINAAMTAELTIPGDQVKAHAIKPSALALNDEGKIGVKYLDEQNRVIFTPVEIIEETTEEMWVAGAPDVMRLITLGQMYVSPGQVIAAENIKELRDQPDTEATP